MQNALNVEHPTWLQEHSPEKKFHQKSSLIRNKKYKKRQETTNYK